MLLGMIVEKVSGMSFINYLQKAVLDPLNIHDVYVASIAKLSLSATDHVGRVKRNLKHVREHRSALAQRTQPKTYARRDR